MTNSKQYSPRKDKFLRATGGSTQMIYILCSNCQHALLLYQKDGPGNLFRLYLDRILAPEELIAQLSETGAKSDLKNLICPVCEEVIGVPMVYKKEERLAYRLIKGKYHKQKSIGAFPP